MSTSAPPPPPNRLTPLRLLGAVAFAVVCFVVVWQGFGLAGFGTDAHALRVLAAVAPLFACGLVLVWPKWSPLRLVAVLVGLIGACVAWWFVPISPEPKLSLSLRGAVDARDHVISQLANPTLDGHDKSGTFLRTQVDVLQREYPSLCKELPGAYDRWAAGVADDIIARYRKTPLDDFQGIDALNEPSQGLVKKHPASTNRLAAARQQWLSNAIHAKTHELTALKPGDWSGFDATATGRRALADALPDTRDELLRTEAEWVDSSVASIVANAFTPNPGGPPSKREFCKQMQSDVLALKSLDAGDNRFRMARARLFKVAHDEAKLEAAAHLAASNYDLAFGTVRTHSVVWSATATVLGRDEQKALTDLRKTYEFLGAFAAKSAKPSPPPEPAPPPRTKP